MADLEDGGVTEMQGSGAKPYQLKNVGGVYSCTCPAWRNQSVGIEQRTCKHLRKLRGDQAETDRIGTVLPAKAKASKVGPPLLLAQTWDTAVDLTDWWMSEKLDGVRAYWDGEKFLSRQGNEYHAPDWFAEGLPNSPLDGELWIDRKAFQKTVSIVRRQDKSDRWKAVRYLVFDAPDVSGTFEERIHYLRDCCASIENNFVEVHEHVRCSGTKHLTDELARVETLGGEGLMLRQPGSSYEMGRSSTLLKVKNFHDAEAEVIGHQAGKGKHKGRLGALLLRLPDGTEFSVGTGFKDNQRENPAPLGSLITFRYQELSDGGVPRFPSFVRIHKTGDGEAFTPPSAAIAVDRDLTSDGSIASTSKRYFELSDEKSQKFWEIQVDDSTVTVRYGRIGATGTSKPKEFASATAAQSHADKLIQQKTDKGYEEQNDG